MYTDKFNLKGDHGSVAEELFSEVTTQEEKFLAIEESVKEGYFTLHEALENYNIQEIDYLPFTLSRLKPTLKRFNSQNQAFRAIAAVISVYDFSIDNFDENGKIAINQIRTIAQGSVQKRTRVVKARKSDIDIKVTIAPAAAKDSNDKILKKR